ncbi:MAG: 50S ribosomal protein L23 [Acidobacteriota bacterium]
MTGKYDIIIRPLLTEKNTLIKEKSRTVCFRVHPDATKVQIKKAVEQMFNTKVASVQVAVMAGKSRRRGKFLTRTPDWKKAFVHIKEGEKMIEFFET